VTWRVISWSYEKNFGYRGVDLGLVDLGCLVDHGTAVDLGFLDQLGRVSHEDQLCARLSHGTNAAWLRLVLCLSPMLGHAA